VAIVAIVAPLNLIGSASSMPLMMACV